MPMTLPPPPAFGFSPQHFPSWRPGQDAAILRVVDSPKRVSVECLPTGSGKTLMAMGVSQLKGARTLILTRRKGLQTQLTRDFEDQEVFDVRGQNAYPCIYSPGVNVDLGPCHAGMFCRYRDAGCEYYDAVKTARDPSTMTVVTNYAFHFMQGKRGQGLGKFDLLICDEAHGIMDELSSFLEIEIARFEIERLGAAWPADTCGEDLERWRAWAAMEAKPRVSMEIAAQKERGGGNTSAGAVREKRRLDSLLERLEDLIKADGKWMVELSTRNGIMRAAPIWPGEYLEECLFRGVPKVLMMSATIREKTLQLLGLTNKDYDYNENQSMFPVDRRMVWCVEAPRMNHRLDEGEKGMWLDKIDQILGKRLDRRQLVHTGSYDRRNYLIQRSRYRQFMMGHGREDVDEMIQRFKHTQPPVILISQSVTEGFDFPYDECESQIIAKIPFPDTRDAITKARTQQDKEYGNYVAMQQIVQAAGRSMRAADDYCETFITDGQARWFMKQNAKFAPMWFNQAVRQVNAPPEPGARVARPSPVGVRLV